MTSEPVPVAAGRRKGAFGAIFLSMYREYQAAPRPAVKAIKGTLCTVEYDGWSTITAIDVLRGQLFYGISLVMRTRGGSGVSTEPLLCPCPPHFNVI